MEHKQISGTSPGLYFKECRKRAGLTVPALAAKLAVPVHEQRYTAVDIRRIERDEPGDYGTLVRLVAKLGAVPRFDLAHFSSLAAATCAVELDPWAFS